MKPLYEMDKKEINDFIFIHLPYSEKGKKEDGEVFTPSELIEKMLDDLPSRVWCDPHLKWLEPTCGVGNFMAIVYFRLMCGLVDWEKDRMKRSNHIIQNMLYMVEKNESNVDICYSIFGNLCNVVCLDFLLFTGKTFKVDKFDVILGNLPFQSKSCLGGKSKLYEKLTIHCLGFLQESTGYMLLITPDNIFSGGSNVYRKMLEQHVIIINLDKKNQGYFKGIQQYICYFLVQKCSKTKILDDRMSRIVKNDGTVMSLLLKDRAINPVRNWTEKTEELICKYISNEKNGVLYNRGKSMENYLKLLDKGIGLDKPHTLIYTVDKFLYTYDSELFVGGGIKKVVVFSISTNLEYKADLSGEYGVGPNTFYIPVGSVEEGQKWVDFLGSEDYKTIALATKTNRQFLKNTFIQHLVCPTI